MKAYKDFIVTPIGERYNNSKNIMMNYYFITHVNG